MGCDTDESLLEVAVETPATQQPDDPMFRAIDGATVLGAKLTNPYSLSVSRAAYDSLSQTLSFDGKGVTVAATHLYVRYEPKNLDDIQKLSKDSTVLLFDAPLDYEIAVPGAGYRDPGLPDGQPGYLYAAVALDYPLAGVGVDYTVLDSLFQPEGEGDTHLVSNGKAYRELERAAHQMAGLDPGPLPVKGRAQRDYRPWAQVWYREDGGALRGLEGVNCHFHYFTRTGQGFTDASGRANSDKEFNYSVNHKIVWERYDFAIKDSWMTRAVLDGPKTKYHTYTITTDAVIGVKPANPDDRDWRRAMVHRGAYRYYYQDVMGLTRPPRNSILEFQLHYRVWDTEESRGVPGLGTHSAGWQTWGFGSQININLHPLDFRTAADYYATTIHETAHAAHWNFNRLYNQSFAIIDARIIESWAEGVTVVLTRPLYPGVQGFFQGDYTPIVLDLIDNDGVTFDGRSNTADQVNGYTLAQIEAGVSGAVTTNQWRTNLQNRASNPTAAQLPALFTYWVP